MTYAFRNDSVSLHRTWTGFINGRVAVRSSTFTASFPVFAASAADRSCPAMRFSSSSKMRTSAGGRKPDLVFFGESVPKDRVDAVHRHVQQSDALLVIGSSLMIYSGYRFAVADRICAAS